MYLSERRKDRSVKEITITTQAEFDALPEKFDEFTYVYIKSDPSIRLVIKRTPESSNVEARGSSHVEARGSSHVEARGSSHVVAWESSHVEAWESSHVEARGSSHVVAWESSQVVAWGSVSVHLQSDYATVILFAFAIVIALAKGKITKKSDTATVVNPEFPKGLEGWFESNAVKNRKSHVVLFKRVSKDFKTQENTKNETVWTIGSKLAHPNPDLKTGECGEGKYHFCSRPYFCDQFRSESTDKYVAVKVPVKSLYAWPNPGFPHKIGGIKAEVLFECDRYGKELK